ncbi:MAG: hypothetical protein FJ309_02380 [Planctomycetes bacterium]|nr:hypothetical protein [Planctomycetota bacterium]MBM4058459.1 hypothetical protein [Planctomycetota bacterium]
MIPVIPAAVIVNPRTSELVDVPLNRIPCMPGLRIEPPPEKRTLLTPAATSIPPTVTRLPVSVTSAAAEATPRRIGPA